MPPRRQWQGRNRQITIYVDELELDMIDECRGDASRSEWARERILDAAVEEVKTPPVEVRVKRLGSDLDAIIRELKKPGKVEVRK